MKYLVTGGAGFIGSHLCEALLTHGYTVRVLDDFSTGKRENLPHGVELYGGDVADQRLVQRAIDGISGCFHLAAVSSVAKANADWSGTHRTNLSATISLFEALARVPKRPPVVYASSAAVYGIARNVNEDAPKTPLSAYGADKYGCELHAHVANTVHHLPTVGLRFFNVYGPRQDPSSPYSGVLSIFCNRLLEGSPVDIHGDGQQARDFVYVSDVVQALLVAMQHPQPAVYNVCTGHATSVLQLATIIHRMVNTGTPLVLNRRPARDGDICHSSGIPDRARHALGLTEPVVLEVGLQHVLTWLNEGA